ncbi:MAG: hypothetical protein KF905_16705 [Flavobacteriales bacterium]|nr:hypothetical protein [Flavobacteriales bacterium]
MKLELHHIPEPFLSFGGGQKALDPRDGLVLFGPHSKAAPAQVRAGVIATPGGHEAYRSFIKEINRPILSFKTVYGKRKSDDIARPSFPGFEAVFGIRWPSIPVLSRVISQTEVDAILGQRSKQMRSVKLAELYLKEILDAQNTEDSQPDIWFIVLPRSVYFKCRPNSSGQDLGRGTRAFIERLRHGQGELVFPDQQHYSKEVSALMDSSTDFHHLLKAKLIQSKVSAPVQITLDSTLVFKDKYRNAPLDENMKAHLAWTQSTTLYYKLGYLPWKLDAMRDDVCYVGLVFKTVSHNPSGGSVCCAAQMFLSDGDGAIFRGNIGPWQSKNTKEFHIDEPSAYQLMAMALSDYHTRIGRYPKELFIHGRAVFSDEEWAGFQRAVQEVSSTTTLVGVTIRDSPQLKLFRYPGDQPANYGAMRGMSVTLSHTEAYLVTRGFIPRLNTATSLEIPNCLHISIVRGEADIRVVLRDVLSLTKLNYNACLYGDGVPVTLRFSDAIGDILTAIDRWQTQQRRFAYYI